MAKIVKLSELNKKERDKLLEQTKKEVAERKAQIESEISFVSKNNSNNNIKLPTAKTTMLPTNNIKSTFGPVQTQQSGINRNIKSNTQTSIKNLANNVVEHKKEKEEKNKFVNKSGLSTIGSDAKIIGSNLLNSAHAGALQFAKTVNMRLDEAENSRRETDKKLLETAIKYREEDGEDVSELKSVLNSDKYKEVDSKPNYQEKIKQINAKMTENTEKASNVFSKKIADLSQGLGNNIVGAGITAINPIAGTTYFIGSATGSYYDEAVEKGMNEDDAKLYAGIMGGMEGATEALLSGQNIKGFKSILKGQTAKDALKAFGIEIGENFIQEAVMEPLSELTTKVTGGDQFLKNDYRTVDGWKNLLSDSFSSGVDGALSAILLNGATKGVASATRVVNKLKSGTKPTQVEIQTAIKDSKEAGVNVEQVLQEQLIKSAEKNLIQQNQANQSVQQNNVAQNTNQINNFTKANTANLPVQRYQYQKSDNIKIDNLRQDASRYFNNSEKASNYVKMLEKIIEDKDIDIRLDGQLKTADGRIANGSYANGVITINPNSTRAGEFIAIHELTHAIGTDQMKRMVQTYRDSNLEFNAAVEKLLENYNTNEINEEALSDISGQLFGNQEFINSLVQNNPNLFQRIYNEIKYLWHQFVGYKNQDQFINDLKYKWEQAYRSNRINKNNNYSIQTNSNGKRYIKVDTDQNIFEGIKEEDYPKIAKMYMQDYLKGNTSLGVNDTAVIGNKGINKYTNPKQQTKYINEKMQLTPELKNVLEVAEKVDQSNPTKDTSKYPNWEYYKFEFELGGKTFEGLINIGIDKNNNKHFYEINKIHTTSSSYVSTNKSSSTDSINNSIPSSNENVNTTKYSIQESENNSGSFNLPKLKEGYTRLYRGLENEYDSNYDKTKLDNSNGYESWTDNYELAKEYGNNVYYIDIPTTEIKNSIIDEDSNSETYGDRNLIYANDKPVGLKGKSGAEYMLYTDHDNYGTIKYNKVNNTSQDNQGRTLTKEQQEYFKDSKVRDENGNLLTMYHGTPNGDHTIFKDGTYFTPRKEYADGYQNTWASAISTKTNASNPKTYEVYLNITNPFTLQNPKAKEIYLNEFIKGGNSLSYDPYTDWTNDINNLEEIDWTEAEDLREWLVENHPEYDGLVLDEGGDGGYGEAEYRWRGKSFVPFNSNQIKNIDNTNPTDDKDIRYALPTKDWEHYLDDNYKPTGTRTNLKEITSPSKDTVVMPTPEKTIQDVGAPINNTNKNTEILTDKDYEVLNKIYEKEGRTEVLTEKRKASLLEKYASDKYKFKDSMDLLSQKFINKGHYIDKLSEQAKNPELKFIYDKNLNSFAEGQYSIGVAQTDNNGNEIGKSINEIWKPVEDSNLTKEFSEYLLHKHNIDRSGKNKYVFGEEIGPTESTAIALDLEQRYPEFKQYAKDIKKFNHNNLENMKKAGLINQEAIDYVESMYPNYIPISRNIEDTIYTGSKEETGTTAPIKKATGGNSDIQPIKDAMAQQVIRIKRLVNQNNLGKELAKTLKNAKVEESVDIELTPSLLFDIETMVETDSEGNKYYTYFENGKQQKLKINDNLYESLRPTEINRLEKTLPVKALQKITNVHRSLLTSSNPLFVVTNFFKDFQDGAFNSKYSRKFIKNYGKALSEIVTKGKYYQSYMANGGMTNTYFDYNEGIKKKGNKFVNKIRSINEIVEQLPRLSEFISTLEDGKSLNEALYNAAEITTNFKRGGDITKAINRNGVNFLNASIQGLDKQYRNLKGQNGVKGYVNLLAKATIMSIAPSILNHMLLNDDEDYQDLPQSTKDLYYLFKYDDGKFIRIPKGRVLSIFGAAARRVIETVQGQEDSWQGFGDTIINQVAPNNPLEDNILAPITQVKNNKTWYGTDLVSSRLQQELPKNQYDETTDELSKWLGSKLNISPKKTNYLLDQYSGALGDILLPMITPQAKQNVVADKFTTDSVLKNKNVSAFYETLEKQTQIANDSLATDEDEIQLKYLNSISKSMSDLYKEKRKVQMSKISNKEKIKKVRDIQEQINQLAEEGLNNYKNTVQGKAYSKVGDEEYYKNSSGEWTKLSEEEKEKKGNISIEIYSDYKQKIYEEKNKQVSRGELKKSQDLKDKDKIQILLDSKYTDKQITQIYETYIRNQNEKEYATISKTGINIKEYLKYKQQDFESDKKDDGTTKGKSISGSKKKKVYNYVNNMKIDYEQRLLLLGMQYSLKDSEKTKLANYINNLKITKDEKLEIYERVSGFKVYKNGTVKW